MMVLIVSRKRQLVLCLVFDLSLSLSIVLLNGSFATSFKSCSSSHLTIPTQHHLSVVLPRSPSRSKRSSRSSCICTSLRENKANYDNENKIAATVIEPSIFDWKWIFTLIFPLWLVYISNQWSRYSISYLVDFSSNDAINGFGAMNVDLGFNQVQYGLLASVAFTCLYAFASLFAGIASDKFDRKLLTVLSCIAWSTATLGTALADSYPVVVLWRIAMGLACAFATPTAYTLIQQNVPPNRVALGSSLYGTGVALGSGLSSLSIILDSAIGWRQTEILIAAVGFAAAGMCTILLPSDQKNNEKNPDTSANEQKVSKTASPSFSSTVEDLENVLLIPRARWLYLASFLRFCSGITIGVWGAPYFRMVFPDSQQQYSVAQAAISAIGATTSGILGGAIADRLSDLTQVSDSGVIDDPVGRRLIVPVVGSILAAPTWYFAIQSGVAGESTFEAAMIWLGLEYLVAECWFGPTISSLQSTVGPKIGGTAQGLFSLTGAAANSAPALLGYLYSLSVESSSTNSGNSDELSVLLMAGVCFGYLSSAFCFWMASRAGKPGNDLKAKRES